MLSSSYEGVMLLPCSLFAMMGAGWVVGWSDTRNDETTLTSARYRTVR